LELTERQTAILDIVKKNGPITGEHIAERLKISRADDSGKKSKTRLRKKGAFKEKSRRSKKYKN